MIEKYISRLMETTPSTFLNTNTLHLDVVVEGGAFNGSYLVGVLYFLKELEKKGRIKIHRFSTCSVSAICSVLYIIDRIDLFENIYRKGLDIFKQDGRLDVFTSIFNIIREVSDENLYMRLNNRLYMTYYDVKNCRHIVKCKYKSNEHLFECMSRSAHIPFVIDTNIARHGRYIDGQQPYFFKEKRNASTDNGRKMLCISLITYSNMNTLTSTLNVKNENNNVHRVLSGTLDAHTFFMTGIPTQMCCFKHNMPMTINIQNKVKQLLLFFIGYLISIIIYATRYIGDDMMKTFIVKVFRVTSEDIYKTFIQHYCV